MTVEEVRELRARCCIEVGTIWDRSQYKRIAHTAPKGKGKGLTRQGSDVMVTSRPVLSAKSKSKLATLDRTTRKKVHAKLSGVCGSMNPKDMFNLMDQAPPALARTHTRARTHLHTHALAHARACALTHLRTHALRTEAERSPRSSSSPTSTLNVDHVGIADGVSTALVSACRYPKKRVTASARAFQRRAARAPRMPTRVYRLAHARMHARRMEAARWPRTSSLLSCARNANSSPHPSLTSKLAVSDFVGEEEEEKRRGGGGGRAGHREGEEGAGGQGRRGGAGAEAGVGENDASPSAP